MRLQRGLASLYDTPPAFRISFQSRHCCSLPPEACTRHGISATHLGILLAPALVFTKYITFILFTVRLYRSYLTNKVLSSGWDPVQYWILEVEKKEVDARHLLHDMKSTCRR